MVLHIHYSECFSQLFLHILLPQLLRNDKIDVIQGNPILLFPLLILHPTILFEMLVEVLQLLVRHHLSHRYHELFEFVQIEHIIVVPIEQSKVVQVFVLFVLGEVFLFGQVVGVQVLTELLEHLGCGQFGQALTEIHSLSGCLHKL